MQWRFGLACGVTLLAAGCLFRQTRPELPMREGLVRDQLVVHSDFDLPRKHRLLDELAAQRGDLATKLQLPTSDEPIHVYLFDNDKQYRAYIEQHYPDLPNRRAFFVETDTKLNVFAHWGDRVAEDLRHEVAHGYLHSVVPGLPLWLDEGLAEYFEVQRGHLGVNQPHIDLLTKRFARDEWTPNLPRLEQLVFADEMTQVDYAESWLWVHFLLETTPERLKIIQDQLARLRIAGSAAPLSATQLKSEPSLQRELIQHLKSLASVR